MSRLGTWSLIGAALVAAWTAFGAARESHAQGYGPGWTTGGGMPGYGMGGGYGMGPGMMAGGSPFNRPVAPGWGGETLDYGQATAYIRKGERLGRADAKANSVTYKGDDITIALIAVEPGHADQSFEVHGLSNPTLVVPVGATVHLDLLNMDYGSNMEHGLILTAAAPPYSTMPMMGTGPGLAAIMPLLPWRSVEAVRDAQYALRGVTFIAREPGTYWYICPTPGHAAEGMFGKLIVE